ncbi:MAG: hypothetical protein RL299_228 [Pseudomonadota bacterium]|jgi:hypothetical protein
MGTIITPRMRAIALWAIGCSAFGLFAVKAIANGAATAAQCACSMGAW